MECTCQKCLTRFPRKTAVAASQRSRRKGRCTRLKVRNLKYGTEVGSGLTIVEGAAMGIVKAALGFGGGSKGKEEL